MKVDPRIFIVTLLIPLLISILTSCGGGGSHSTARKPFIYAKLDSFPTGSAPLAFYNGTASVSVVDDATRVPFTNATVTINGVALLYNSANQQYKGNVIVPLGDPITLSINVNGNVYTASTNQYSSCPTISSPAQNDKWFAGNTNSIMWSGGTPTMNAKYVLGVLDANNPNGKFIWPADNFLQELPISATTYTIPANSLTAGDRYVIVGIETAVTISGAANGSGFIVAGFNYMPITVTEPVVLASFLGQSVPNDIAVDSTSVYWADFGMGTVNKVGINGGAVTTLATGTSPSRPSGITIDSTSVYWTEWGGPGTVKKTGINGGTVTTLAAGLSTPDSIAVDSTSVYWAECGALKKIGINGGTIKTLSSGLSPGCGGYEIAIDSTSVYWTDYSSGTVNKVGKNGGAVITLVSGLSGPIGIAVDPTDVYWVEKNSGTMKKVPINGGTVSSLASGLIDPYGIVVDSNNVYWAEYTGGFVKRVGVNGGSVTTLASRLPGPYYLAEDSANVYWGEQSGGHIKKIDK